jgi:phage terminase large subunit-like protein
MQAFEKALLAGKIRHDGNPVLAWAASNLVARKDPNDNLAPDRKHSAEKIDPIVAALMAVGRAISTGAAKSSVYENRGITFL